MSQELAKQLVRAAESAGYLIYVDVDPSVTAVDAVRGTIATRRTVGAGAWCKMDDGLSTNWQSLMLSAPPIDPLNAALIYVDKNGDDSIADGTELRPYRTFTAALASIGPNTSFPLQPRTIIVKPGEYNEEPGNLVQWKNGVSVFGYIPSQASLSFEIQMTAPADVVILNFIGITIGKFTSDMTLALFYSISFKNGAFAFEQLDTNQSGIFGCIDCAINPNPGNVSIVRSRALMYNAFNFGNLTTVESGGYLLVNGNLFVNPSTPAFEIQGTAVLRTLACTAYGPTVNGTPIGPDTPTWETDVASDAGNTGTLTKVVL